MTEKPQRLMITFKDPLTNSPCVRWYRDLAKARKFIRSLAFDVPYSVTVNEDYTFRGTYFALADVFIEMPSFGRCEYDGEVYDKNI